MPIKKRPVKKSVKKKPVNKHAKLCKDLYNRLQQPHPLPHDFGELANLAGCTDAEPHHLAAQLMVRTDAKLKTLQMNYPNHVSVQATLSYADHRQPPIDGYLYYKQTVVKTSPHWWQSVILAYIELCKHIGRFI
jgi:hypothetical protein